MTRQQGVRPATSQRGGACARPHSTVEPLVSVVVINHNYGRFLREAVDSALAQDHDAVEIVVVDDGSTDGSGAVLDALPTGIIQVRQAQCGHVRALNAGFAACAGQIVIFLDADDVLYPDCVTKVLAAWRPGCIKVQYRLDTIDAGGRDLHLQFPAYAGNLDTREIRARALRSGYYPWPVSSGNAFSRAYLEQVLPIDAGVIFKSPDGFMNKMAPLFGDVLTASEVLGGYRVHGRNAWAHSAGSATLPNYARTVRFDAVLHQAFVKRAAAFGHAVGPYERMAVLAWLEMRFLSLRLAKTDHPIAGDTVHGVLRHGLRAVRVAPDTTLAGRVLWSVWFLALATCPKPLLARVVRMGRSQSRRSRLARLAVSWSRRP